MKLKKVIILVESLDKTSERWEKALQSKVVGKQISGYEIISVENWDILGKVLSPPRLQLLSMIGKLKPKSISDLAKKLKKDFKNVHSDVQFLADLGMIDLKVSGPKKTITPIAKFSGIEVAWAA